MSKAVAPLLGVEVTPVNMRDPKEIERDVAAFAGRPNGGLIVTGSPLAAVHRHLIAKQAAQHELPAVYPQRLYVEARWTDLLRAQFLRSISTRCRLR